MYCSKCGKEIKDDATFCPYCGTPVNNANTNPNNHAQRNQDTQEPDQIQDNNGSEEGGKAKKSHRGLIIAIVAVAVIIVIAVVATDGHETDSHLKNLAQAGGISPYTYKEDVISIYGKGNYNEGSEHNGLLDVIIDDLNAELVQSGLEEKGDYNNGIYLLTYSNELDTSKDNDAEADMITILSALGGDVSIVTNDDWNIFVASNTLTSIGDHETFFYITGNTMIFSLAHSSDLTSAVEIMRDFNSNSEYGIYGIDQALTETLTENLNDISDEVNELIKQKRHISNEQIDRGDE